MNYGSYHKREANSCALVLFDDPHDSKAHKLNDCEEMDFRSLDMTQVDVIWLVLGGHEEKANPVHKLM